MYSDIDLTTCVVRRNTVRSWCGDWGVLLTLLAFILCSAFSPIARGALPPPAPDGGYPGQNTAEGQQALKNLNYTPTSGNAQNNTAVGFEAMFATSTGSSNTGERRRSVH